jgi:hypothetical protein
MLKNTDILIGIIIGAFVGYILGKGDINLLIGGAVAGGLVFGMLK